MVVRAPNTAAFSTTRPFVVRHVAAGLPDVLEVRLKRPAGGELHGVADLEQRLVIARNRRAEIDVEGADLVGDAGIGEADGEDIVGPAAGSCRRR